jgi:serine/threonine protein kinase
MHVVLIGKPIFDANIEGEQIENYIALLGLPPPSPLFSCCKRSSEFFTPNMQLKHINALRPPHSTTLAELLALEDSNDTGLVTFVADLIKLDPCQRMTAAQALQHPFIRHDSMLMDELMHRAGVITTEL